MQKRYWFLYFSLLFLVMLLAGESKADVCLAFWGEAVEYNCYFNIEVKESSVTVHQRIEMKLRKWLSDDYVYAFITTSTYGKFDENSLWFITPPSGLKDSVFDHGCKLDYISKVSVEETLKVAFEYEYDYPGQNLSKIVYERTKATAKHGYVIGEIVDTNECIDIVCNQDLELQEYTGVWKTVSKGTHIVYHPPQGAYNFWRRHIFGILLSPSGEVDTLGERMCFDVVPQHWEYLPNLIKDEFITIQFTEGDQDVFDYRLYGTIELNVEVANLFAPFYAWFPNDQTDAWVKLDCIYERFSEHEDETYLWHEISVLRVEPGVVGEQKGFYIFIPELSDPFYYSTYKCTKATLLIEIEGQQSEKNCNFILVTAPQEYSSVRFKIPEKFSFGNCFSPFEHDLTFQEEEFKAKKFYGKCLSTGIAHVEWGTSASPENVSLFQNYPNPFNQETIIKYSLPSDCEVKLFVYNLLGERVKTLVDEPKSAGNYEIRWEGKDDQGKELASGVYLYRLQTGKFTQSNKMLLLK
jgi:hypothetical protein